MLKLFRTTTLAAIGGAMLLATGAGATPLSGRINTADPIGLFGDAFLVPAGNPMNINTYPAGNGARLGRSPRH